MREILDVTKAPADGNRPRVRMALRGGELGVCQIVALLQIAPSTTSKHMAILRQARLVESRAAVSMSSSQVPRSAQPGA